MAHNIAVIGGDGIGPEVTAEAVKVVRAAGVDISTTDFDLGGSRYLRDGEILGDPVLDELRAFDCILLGAVGTPEVLSLIHISEPTRPFTLSRMPSSA